jgi:hypothetical protein
MSLLDRYHRLRHAGQLSESRAKEIVQVARPHAAALLAPAVSNPEELRVTPRLVPFADNIGGSLIPAWPIRHDDGSVTIEFVPDWGAMLAGWTDAAGPSDDPSLDIEALVTSGERLWVGIANDVLQMFVPNPPDGTYSMVRHHALMLGAAILWLGPEPAGLWQRAHSQTARALLRRHAGRPLWDIVAAGENGLKTLLADARAREEPESVLAWLDADEAAGNAYRDFHGAASLGIAAVVCPAEIPRLRSQAHSARENSHPDRLSPPRSSAWAGLRADDDLAGVAVHFQHVAILDRRQRLLDVDHSRQPILPRHDRPMREVAANLHHHRRRP